MDLTAAGRARGSTSASIDHFGRLIVTGRPGYRPGQVISLEMVSEEAGVSRAMAREVLQVLHQKRLVGLQPRVGATVRPVEQWDVFDPDVINWRLEIAPRFQMRSLTEMRQAIEPSAAFLAAERASADVCRDLVSLSLQLQELGGDKGFGRDDQEGERVREAYRDADAQFHRALLKGSQNEMFSALADPVEQALNYRIQRELEGSRGRGSGGNKLFPRKPEPLALWLHRGLAAAVEQGHPSAAEAFSRAILVEVRTEDRLPHLIGIALEHALPLLDRRSMDVGGRGWTQFEEAIRAAVEKAKEGS
jgi:DNA-binding FadR family transcriptional regulator